MPASFQMGPARAREFNLTGPIEGVITFTGNQENLASREAAFFALLANLVMVAAAIVSILVTVPKGKSVERVEPAPAKRVNPKISGELS